MPLQTPTASVPQPGTATNARRPLTSREVNALEQRQEALLLEQATLRARRGSASVELQTVRGSPLRGRAGRIQHASQLEQEIAQLDGRLVRIQIELDDIARRLTGQLVASEATPLAPPPLQPPIDPPYELVAAVAIVFIILAIGPISLALARLIWKRTTTSRNASASLETSPRLERLEQSVDAIAVEVERISEGQRYVTRLLSESPNFAGDAARVRVPEAVPRVPSGRSPSDER